VTFDNLNKWRQGFIDHAGASDTSMLSFVLIGNKLDLDNYRKIMSSKAQQWCKQNGNIPYFETSARENVAVEEAFVEMAVQAL
jgi:GTPase SAR1 family protein